MAAADGDPANTLQARFRIFLLIAPGLSHPDGFYTSYD